MARVSNPKRRKLADLLLAQIFPLVASMIMTFATAAILGTSGRGVLALVISSAGLVGALGYLSLQVGIVRAFRLGDVSAPKRGFKIAFLIAILVLVLGIVPVMLNPGVRIGLFDGAMIVMVACGGALVIVNLVVLRTYQGLGYSRVFRDAWLIQSVVFPMLGVPVALAFHSPFPVVACWYVALALSTAFALSRRNERREERPGGSHVPRIDILKTSIAAHVGVAGQQLLHSADVVVLGLMVSASAVGVYSIAVPIAGMIWVFSEALSLIAFDSGSRRATAADQRAQRSKLTRLNFIVGVLACVAIGLGSTILIPLLLPKYVAAVPLILILLPGVLIQGYARIGLSSILTSGSKRSLVLIGLTSAALCVLYLPFVGALGATGAAIASSVIYSVQTFVVLVVIRKRMKNLELEEANVAE
ncbi:hypothetical protein E3N86_09200 [Cryobacterium sp. Hz7]|uniref:hypothetical protein n=1 Tax=Cryobacterium sp. Hz7 TaxID=1259166 RepID=UPI00106D4366|nr:hypothetical protein [Cryobacterium sp. Hz7]TFB60251.1 hypothetical protein E3N86_09200 [Cryobacterium sp. Hz7]